MLRLRSVACRRRANQIWCLKSGKRCSVALCKDIVQLIYLLSSIVQANQVKTEFASISPEKSKLLDQVEGGSSDGTHWRYMAYGCELQMCYHRHFPEPLG